MANATSLDEETAKKVIRQVEFYFSDSNLPRDSFLKQAIRDSEDGLVSLALICSFSRMRTHLGLGDVKPENVSEDTVKAVAETLRTSSSSILKISEDGKKVGRATELAKPEEVMEQLDVRTIAASPLPYDVNLEDVESFFAQFAKVNSVRLPRHTADKRLFSGTALIEFSLEEDATKILGQSLVYAGLELELKPKKDFDIERAKQEGEAKNSRPQHGSHRNNASPEADYPKGLIVAFKLKSITAEGATNKNGSNEPAADNASSPKSDDSSQVATELKEQKPSEDVMDQENNENADGGEEKDVQKDDVHTEIPEGDDAEVADGGSAEKDEQASVRGISTFAANKDNKDVVLREDLKSAFRKFGTVKFVDFNMGSDSGYIRFEDAEAAQRARAAAVLAEEGGLIVKNYIAILDPVSGEAEKEYWSLLRNNKEKHRDNFKGNRGRGGKHHRGWKHSRSRDNNSATRPNKTQKVGAA